jgi:hypothetical protein
MGHHNMEHSVASKGAQDPSCGGIRSGGTHRGDKATSRVFPNLTITTQLDSCGPGVLCPETENLNISYRSPSPSPSLSLSPSTSGTHPAAIYQTPNSLCFNHDSPHQESKGEDQIVFPSYDDLVYCEPAEMSPLREPPQNHMSVDVPTSDEQHKDDLALQSIPTRNVDYLSHRWREQDIWASRKHVKSKTTDYSNEPRLMNASWRTWAKIRFDLGTVSPESIKWYLFFSLFKV